MALGLGTATSDERNFRFSHSSYASYFDGDAHAQMIDNADFSLSTATMGFAFSVWFKPNAVGANQTLFAKAQGTNEEYKLYITAANRLRFQVYDESAGKASYARGNSTVSVDKWYHVVAQIPQVTSSTPHDEIRIWLNGEEETIGASQTQSGYVAPEDTTSIMTIGTFRGSDYFTGWISDISVWTQGAASSTIPLTDAQVKSLYNSGSPTNLQRAHNNGKSPFSGNIGPAAATNNLTGWWRLGDDSSGGDSEASTAMLSSHGTTTTGLKAATTNMTSAHHKVDWYKDI